MTPSRELLLAALDASESMAHELIESGRDDAGRHTIVCDYLLACDGRLAALESPRDDDAKESATDRMWRERALYWRGQSDGWQAHAGTSDREVAALRLQLAVVMEAMCLPPMEPSLLWQDSAAAIMGRLEEIVDQANEDAAAEKRNA